MQISSRFTIAVHLLTALNHFEKDYKITSDFLAGSIQVNPVIVRRTMQQLKAAGMIAVKRGQGGMSMAKPLEEITLYDIYRAVDSVEDEQLFHFHENPNPECPVGRNIHKGLDDKLAHAQLAMETSLKETTLADVIRDTEAAIDSENP